MVGDRNIRLLHLCRLLEDPDLALAATVHPKFKLSWMMKEGRAATLYLSEEEFRALEAFCNENQATGDGSDEDNYFFHLPQASSSSADMQQWVHDPGTDLSELEKFPKIKVFIGRNTGICSSGPAERLFSKGRNLFSIKRGKLLDGNFEQHSSKVTMSFAYKFPDTKGVEKLVQQNEVYTTIVGVGFVCPLFGFF